MILQVEFSFTIVNITCYFPGSIYYTVYVNMQCQKWSNIEFIKIVNMWLYNWDTPTPQRRDVAMLFQCQCFMVSE